MEKSKESRCMFLYLTVFILLIMSVYSYSPEGICRVIQNQLIVVQHEEENSLRLLGLQIPHNFRIKPYYHIDTNVAFDFANFQNMFKMATHYYSRIIQVTDIPQQKTKYPQKNNQPSVCVHLQVPQQYLNIGFNQDQQDAIFFVKFFEDTSYVVGQSTSCVLYRWVLYGYMEFNNRFIPESFNNAQYHEYVLTIVHEITHVIGFAEHFWSENRYYKNYFSWEHISQNQVVKKLDTGYNVIILPSVIKYVKSFFGCENQIYKDIIGGLLQNQGGGGTANNHWQRAVYLDQLMTGSIFQSGLRISPITFHLLADTGFFYSVDAGLTEEGLFGRGKGCQFALAQKQSRSQRPQFCSPIHPEITSEFQCDYYGLYGGYCDFHPYSSKRPYIQFPVNSNEKYICPWQGTGIQRCLNKISGGTGCYEAQCYQQGIEIKYNNQIAICTQQTQNVHVGGQTVKCPQIQRFCWRKNCQNWCQKKGLCIKKQCHSLSCDPSSIPNCNSCQDNSLIKICKSCKIGFKPSQTGSQCVCDASSIPHCNSCQLNSQNQVICNLCQNLLMVASDGKKCECNASNINFCSSCDYLSNGQQYCTSCVLNYIPTADGKSCKCDYRSIDRCQSCEIVDNQKKCRSCKFDYQPSVDSSKCERKKGNPYCKTLQQYSLYLCSTCYDGFYLNEGNCQTCNPECYTCQNSAANCTS